MQYSTELTAAIDQDNDIVTQLDKLAMLAQLNPAAHEQASIGVGTKLLDVIDQNNDGAAKLKTFQELIGLNPVSLEQV